MILRPTAWLFAAGFTLAFSAGARADVTSCNTVGYLNASIKRGDNTVGMPQKVNGGAQLVEDVIQGLVDGDAILVEDQFGEQRWGRVIEEGEEKHVYVDDRDEPVDDWKLPSIAGEQVLKVKRQLDMTSDAPLSGEFSTEVPLQLPEYTGEAPLSKIKVGKETARKLQAEVTITNRVTVPFPTSVPKKFEMILKDGRRFVVQVDPDTRLVVDAATGRPVNVGAAEIEAFGEIKGGDIPKAEKAESAEIRPIVKEVAQGATDYDFRKAIREGIIGAAWDSDHKWQSILCWLVIVAVLSFLNKIFDWGWGWVLKGLGWLALRFLAACWCVAKCWWLLLVATIGIALNVVLWPLKPILKTRRRSSVKPSKRRESGCGVTKASSGNGKGMCGKNCQRKGNGEK